MSDAAPPIDPDPAELLRDAGRWAGVTSAQRTRAAEWVGRRTEGFSFRALESVSAGGDTHEIAVFHHAATRLEFVLLPAGEFSMGSLPTELGRYRGEARRRITLARPFLIARTECTQAAWDRVGGSDERKWGGDPRRPIDSMTWAEARAWCERVGLRLPSEAEWEYACRAGTATRYWSGDDEADLARVGWYPGNVDRGTQACGLKPANAFGLFDVHGNLWEWCEDAYDPTSGAAPADGSAKLNGSYSARVIRGGSFVDPAGWARSARRHAASTKVAWHFVGFRPVRTIDE